MISKLPIFLTIKNSFIEIIKNKKFSFQIICLVALCIFIEAISIKIFPENKAFENIATVFCKYFVFFTLIRIYFKKTPIFKKEIITASLKKSVSIIILVIATLSMISILYKFGDLFTTYAYIPKIIKNAFLEYEVKKHMKFIITSIVFFMAIFSIIIPTFAWVCSVIGMKKASITKAFFKIKDNYIRLVCIIIIYYISFKIINKIAYMTLYDFSYYTYKTVEKTIEAFDYLVKIYMYLNIYKFFYSRELRINKKSEM